MVFERYFQGEFQSDLFKTMSILFISISKDDSASIYGDVRRELLDLIKTGKPGAALSLAICSSGMVFKLGF